MKIRFLSRFKPYFPFFSTLVAWVIVRKQPYLPYFQLEEDTNPQINAKNPIKYIFCSPLS